MTTNAVHEPTVATLDAIADPIARIKRAAKISKAARNKLGIYGEPKGGPGLMDQRNDAIVVLHMIYDVSKSEIARQLGRDRRMVGAVLDKQAADLAPVIKAMTGVPEWSEDEAIEAAREHTEQAVKCLYFRHQLTKPQISRRAKIRRSVVQDVLEPILRQMLSSTMTREEAEKVLKTVAKKIDVQRAIWLTASGIAQAIGVELMNGEHDGHAWENQELVDLTGLASPTVSQWRTGNSNRWKKEARRGLRTPKEKVPA